MTKHWYDHPIVWPALIVAFCLGVLLQVVGLVGRVLNPPTYHYPATPACPETHPLLDTRPGGWCWPTPESSP